MLVLRHIFFLHFGSLKQCVSVTIDRTRWTSSMSCWFPDVIPLHFYLCIYIYIYIKSSFYYNIIIQMSVKSGSFKKENIFWMIFTTGIFQSVRRSLFRYATCTETQSGHLENFLHSSRGLRL